VSRPIALDLFCGAGGSAEGWHRAGYDVVGVDIEPQPRYPFTFIRADALIFLADNGGDFDLRAASPPCQKHSALTKGTNYGREYADHIPRTRELLTRIGGLWVIENVAGAPIRRDLMLCGEMFGLEVIRHRFFEMSQPIERPAHPKHRGRVAGWRHGKRYDGPYFAVHGDGGGKGSLSDWQRAMGIPWMTEKKELAEAIPPAYTEYIGRRLLGVSEVAA
jgi:hypothetical protein